MESVLKLELTTIRYLSMLAEAFSSAANRERHNVSLDLLSKINDHIEHIAQQALENHSSQSRRSGLEPSIRLLMHIVSNPDDAQTLTRTQLHIPSKQDVEGLQQAIASNDASQHD